MARTATIQLLLEGVDSAENKLADLAQGLERVEASSQDAESGFQGVSSSASQELAQVRSEAQQAARSMDQVAGSSASTANSLGIELTQAAQDASFGVAGVANQLPQLQLEFQRLRDQTGSATGALSSLGSTFIGPTGVLAAGTLLLQFWPQIVSAFSDTADSAKEASEEVKGLAKAAGSVLDVTSDELKDLELSLGQVDEAIATTESRIGTLQSRIDQLEGAQSFIEGAVFQDTDIPLEDIGQAQLIVAQTTLSFEQLREARQQGAEELQALIQDRLEATRQELDTERGVNKNLTEQQKKLQEQLRVQERLEGLGGKRADNEGDAADEAERLAKALREITQIDAAIQGVMRLERTDQVLADPQADLRGGINQTIDQTGLAGSRRELGQTRFGLDQALTAGQQAGFLPQMGSSLEEVLGTAEDTNNEMQDLGDSIQSQVAQTGVQAFTAIGSAMAGAQSEAEALQQVTSSLMSGIGRLLIQAALTSGGVGAPLGILGGGLLAGGAAIQSFEDGGRPQAGMAQVHPPELMMMGGQERIIGRAETTEILKNAGNRAGNTDAVVRKLDEVAARIETTEVRLDAHRARRELRKVNESNALNTEYPAQP